MDRASNPARAGTVEFEMDPRAQEVEGRLNPGGVIVRQLQRTPKSETSIIPATDRQE
jgi:hypothetical protein